MSMNMSIEKITPERAGEMLALNRHNRNARQRHVQAMAADMTAGNWRLNGETIKLAADGTLLDGQHRLLAVIESGVTVEMAVVTGLDLSDQDTMDTGRKRTLADVLALRGEENPGPLASAINWFWRRRTGNVTSNASPTTPQGLAMLEQHPELRNSISAVRKAVRTFRYPFGLAAALHYEMATRNPDDAADFWAKLESGLDLHEKHPVYIVPRAGVARTVALDN